MFVPKRNILGHARALPSTPVHDIQRFDVYVFKALPNSTAHLLLERGAV
jgi:hypothetical protein